MTTIQLSGSVQTHFYWMARAHTFRLRHRSTHISNVEPELTYFDFGLGVHNVRLREGHAHFDFGMVVNIARYEKQGYTRLGE